MNNIIFLSFLIFVMIGGCKKINSPKKISFYHWKSKAIYPKSYENVLNLSKTKKIYLHYFDVEIVHNSNLKNNKVT